MTGNSSIRRSTELTGGEAVVEALECEGVDLLFGLPGISILPIYDRLYFSSKIRHLTVKHEASAAIMADMYGRLTGSVGVCLTIAGPGATNAVTAVAQAYDAASPMIHISGAELGGGKYEYFHGVDEPDFLRRIFEPVTKWSYRIESVEEIPQALAKAFRIAQSGRTGPVHIEVPWDVLESRGRVNEYVKQPPMESEPTEDAVRDLANILSTAEKPLIIVGRSVLRCFASKEVTDLAEILSAPIVVTAFEPSIVPSNHPLLVGDIEYYVSASSIEYYAKNPIIVDLFRETDTILSVGVRLGTPESELLKKASAARIVHIDVEDNRFRGEYDLYREVVCDIKIFLERLNAELRRRGSVKKRPHLVRLIGESKESLRRKLDEAVVKFRNAKPIHPAVAVKELRKVLDRDAIVVSDVGMCQAWLKDYFEVYMPNSYIDPGCYGSMGFALPAAITAKLVFPDRQIAAVMGDGAFLMSLGEFHTAVENDLAIMVVILNDSKYNSIWHTQKSRYDGRFIACDLRPSSFSEYAKVYGVKGLRVTEPSQLNLAYEEALSSKEPSIVEVLIDHRVGLARYSVFAKHLR